MIRKEYCIMTSQSGKTQFNPGMRVRISQQIPKRDTTWITNVEGEVISYESRTTGSWYAHGKDGRLWLDRIEIRKDDGEITVCNLDQYSRVEIIDDGSGSD